MKALEDVAKSRFHKYACQCKEVALLMLMPMMVCSDNATVW